MTNYYYYCITKNEQNNIMKAENKSEKLVVRLTPYQDFMIKEITNKYNVSKSSLVRFILDEFLNKLEENEQ